MTEAGLRSTAQRALAAWNRAESNRGCYSCAGAHDGRCCSNWEKPEPCNCGRDELDAAMTALEAELRG